MNKIISLDQAVDLIKDGDTVMVGGFMANGTPERIVDALVAKGTKNLTLICNDAGLPDKGVGKMVMTKQFSKNYCFSYRVKPRSWTSNERR